MHGVTSTGAVRICAACLAQQAVCSTHTCVLYMCAVHIPVQLCMEQAWARSPICRKRAHISSLPAPTAGVTSPPHCDAFAPFPSLPSPGSSGSESGPEHPVPPVGPRHFSALRSHGPEPVPGGDSALGKQRFPRSLRPRSAHTARPGPAVGGPDRRGSPAPLPPLSPGRARRLLGGSDAPAPAAGFEALRDGCGVPLGSSSLPSP